MPQFWHGGCNPSCKTNQPGRDSAHELDTQLKQSPWRYGYGYGSESTPYSANTRDRLGNRVIINGMIEGGSGLGTGLYTGWGQTDGASGMIGTGTAVCNQLNVITNGSNNTIIIVSTQINNGDQTVVLNGELDF